MGFQFEIAETVKVGDAEGVVIGRSEYAHTVSAEKTYYVEFVHPQTKLPAREWFPESQVSK